MLTLDERWMDMTDEELGKHFFTLWIMLQAEKKDIAPQSISPEFVAEIKSTSLIYDDENLEEVAIEAALSHLAKENWAKGAIILRKVILQGAESIASINIAKKYVPFLPGKRKGALKPTNKYLKELKVIYPNESAKFLYKLALDESRKGITPFEYDRNDGGMLLDGDIEIDFVKFEKKLSKAGRK